MTGLGCWIGYHKAAGCQLFISTFTRKPMSVVVTLLLAWLISLGRYPTGTAFGTLVVLFPTTDELIWLLIADGIIAPDLLDCTLEVILQKYPVRICRAV